MSVYYIYIDYINVYVCINYLPEDRTNWFFPGARTLSYITICSEFEGQKVKQIYKTRF